MIASATAHDFFPHTADVVITDPAGRQLTLRAGGGNASVRGWGDLHARSSTSDRHRYVSAAGSVSDDSSDFMMAGGSSSSIWYTVEARRPLAQYATPMQVHSAALTIASAIINCGPPQIYPSVQLVDSYFAPVSFTYLISMLSALAVWCLVFAGPSVTFVNTNSELLLFGKI